MSINKKYMVFFIRKSGDITRSDEIDGYDKAIDAAKAGPSGARFQLVDITSEDYKVLLDGYVS